MLRHWCSSPAEEGVLPAGLRVKYRVRRFAGANGCGIALDSTHPRAGLRANCQSTRSSTIGIMEDFWLSSCLLLLLGVANGSPVIATWLLDPRWRTPLDGGMRLFDGRPLLGPSKTVRGVIAAIVAAALAAPMLGIPLGLGVVIGAAAMTGDALSSFTKRRLGITSSGRATGLDQIPESLLPLLAVQGPLHLSCFQILGITAAFFALEMPLARLFYRLGIRDTPY